MSATKSSPESATKSFNWIPSAINFRSDGGLAIYVKYGKNPDRITIKQSGNGYLWLECPDRDLVMVCNHHTSQGVRPKDGTYDEVVHLGLYHDHLNEDMNVPAFMVNYIAESTKKGSTANSRKGLPVGTVPQSKILCDSGGYQILNGRVEFLDPNSIVEWYNDNVDIGLALDIPVAYARKDLQLRASAIQRTNNDIMIAKRNERLELMNIIHGNSGDNLLEYHSWVENDEMEHLAIAGLYYSHTLLESIHSLATIANELRPYNTYHILGIANPLHVSLLMRTVQKGLVPHITTDSSTAMQKARLREWHCNTAIHQKVKFIPVGFKDGYIPSTKSLLPCSCTVCSTIKYADALWSIGGNIATKIFEFHNIHSMQGYFTNMFELCGELSSKELKTLLGYQIGASRAGFGEALKTIDLIDSIARNGLEESRSKFAYYLGDAPLFGDADATGTKALFDTDDEGSHHVSDDMTPAQDAYVNAILSRYEHLDPVTSRHGKKIKTEVNNTRATKNASGGVSRKAVTANSLRRKANANDTQATTGGDTP